MAAAASAGAIAAAPPRAPAAASDAAAHLISSEQPLIVMSFGCVCFTARSLGVAGGRTFAAPFDWIFSNPRIVEHVISTGGAALLDMDEYMEPPGSAAHGSTGTCHRTYSPMLQADPRKKSNKHGIIFSHHDPACTEGHAYLQRTVRRLTAALASHLPKLCVVVSLEKRGKVDDGELDRLHETLARDSNPVGHVELVVVKLTVASARARTGPPGLPEARHRQTRLGNTMLRVVELTCRRGLCSNGLALVDAADRRDLLVAIFGNRAIFDGPDLLTFPKVAADPLTSVDGLSPPETACADMPETVRSLWCNGHTGVHTKYSEDSYMASGAWAHCEEKRRAECASA